MKLENLFNESGTFYKVVAMKNGDEFTEGCFEDVDKAFEYAHNCYDFLSDYDKKHEQIAVQRFEIENVIEIDCDLEDESDIDSAREYLLFSGYEESIIKGEEK